MIAFSATALMLARFPNGLFTPMPDGVVTLLQRALSSQTKSTVLKGLASFISVCGLLAILAYRVPEAAWMGLAFGILAVLGALSFLAAYWYFAFTNPDALRSERFTIQKMALEKGFIGDSASGYVRVTQPTMDTLEMPQKADPPRELNR